MAFGAGVIVSIYEFSAGPPLWPQDSAVALDLTGAGPLSIGRGARAELDHPGSESGGGAATLASLGQAFDAVDEDGHYGSFPDIHDDPAPFDAQAKEKFPNHGLVSSGSVTVRRKPDVKSERLGLLRVGTSLRVDAERTFGGGCSQGWRAIFPRGWVCLNAGVRVGAEPIDKGMIDVADPDESRSMPLEYWRVSGPGTPFFHRLPTFAEQDQADAEARRWLDVHGKEPMPSHPQKRPKEVPGVVKEYLNAGYYVTIAAEHERMKRRFLRTNRGAYARKYQLEQRKGSDFRGIVLAEGATDLPVYWVVREMPLRGRDTPNSGILTKSETTLPRRSRHSFVRKVRIGDYDYYEDSNGMLLRAYAVGRSYKLKRPAGIGPEERWIHVDLSEQTLVAYVGDRPVFTTIVSTGKEDGMTPVGIHRIQSKFVVTSMRDQPIEEEAYSIEDVPWTQYFSNNVALHGAFWHGGFGLVRSHGCVNLSPADARWLFGFTTPRLPDRWHAVIGDSGASAVVITK